MPVKQINTAPLADEGDPLAQLARAAASGDADAFAGIYRLLAGDVYAYVRAQCSDAEACDDIVAEVFLKAWSRARTQDAANHSYRSWIFTIARNELHDQWRREGRAEDLVAAINELPPACVEEDPDQDAMRRLAASSMSVLTDDQRDVVMLRMLGGLSTAEVARMLETNEGAVRALQFRAFRRMRAAKLKGANA